MTYLGIQCVKNNLASRARWPQQFSLALQLSAGDCTVFHSVAKGNTTSAPTQRGTTDVVESTWQKQLFFYFSVEEVLEFYASLLCQNI